MMRLLVVPVVFAMLCSHLRGADESPWFGAGYHSQSGLALDDGFTDLSLFLPLQSGGDWVVFSDNHLLLFDEQSEQMGFNLGGGIRRLNEDTGRIHGAFMYWDYRESSFADFHQVSLGTESLGEDFDFRLWGHFPVGAQSSMAQTSQLLGPFGPVQTTTFTTAALNCVQGEATKVLFDQGHCTLRFAAGAYGVWGGGVATTGPRLRLEADVSESLWVNSFLQTDDYFGTTGGIQVVFRLGVCDKDACDCHSHRCHRRLTEQVRRMPEVKMSTTTTTSMRYIPQ